MYGGYSMVLGHLGGYSNMPLDVAAVSSQP
jgi:hypothetical protein